MCNFPEAFGPDASNTCSLKLTQFLDMRDAKPLRCSRANAEHG
jgi:hypothetical protein